MEPVRISKLLAARGLCSRREADRFIEAGLVLVDGVPVTQLGVKVLPDQHIELAPAARKDLSQQVTILLHKPLGLVSGQPEEGYRSAAEYIDANNQWEKDRSGMGFSRDHLKGLAPAGRLDIDSQGLLVLTQDGVIARQLIGPESQVDKEYIVGVSGRQSEAVLERLRHGLYLDGRELRPAGITTVGANRLRFVLREGRKRQIRRMCELVGLRVISLKRVRIGNIMLGDLPYGEWRFLLPGEKF